MCLASIVRATDQRGGVILLAVAALTLGARAVAIEPGAEARWRSADVSALIAFADGIASEGLEPGRYEPTALATAVADADEAATEAAATELFRRIATDLLEGASAPSGRPRWRIEGPRATSEALDGLLTAAIVSKDVGGTLGRLSPAHRQFVALKSALASAQDRETADKIRLNMERWRWMPRALGEDYIFVNVPSQDLVLVRGGAEADRRRIIAGARKTPTPQFATLATGVAFNPTWFVPASIAESEGIWALLQKKPDTARRKGYYIGEDGGLRQKPGPDNPLGRMKLIMPNPFSVFIHDTPAVNRFESERRLLSHGCIRVAGALEFATSLLGPVWDADMIADVVNSGATTTVELSTPIPVYVGYFTALADADGELQFYPDVYGLDAILARALEKPQTDKRAAARVADPCSVVAGD